jgi:micrococcal nuclease
MRLKTHLFIVLLVFTSLALSACGDFLIIEEGSSVPVPTIDPFICIPENAQSETAEVVKVVDGDTLHVLIDGERYKLRLIGIDTPEDTKEVEFFGPEATARAEEIFEDKTVTLYKDVSETDQYGRLLRYVVVDGMFANYQMIAEGYAEAVTFPPDVACADVFNSVEREAREQGLGLWNQD